MIKSKKEFYKNTLYLGIVVIIFAGLMTVIGTGCGGSGGGGGGNDEPEAATQAKVDQENVDASLEFITETVPVCSIEERAASRSSAATAPAKTVRSVIKIAKELMEQIEFSYHARSTRDRSIRAEETSEHAGDCGGLLTLTSNENDATGNFTVSVVFDDFCLEPDETTVSVDGEIDVSGNTDTETDDITSIEADSNGISIVEGDESYTITFDVSATKTGNQTIINVPSFSVKDESTGETFIITNLIITATEGDTTTQVQITGRFTHSEDGYVDITTPQTLVVNNEGEITEGKLKFSGADNTYILLTATGNDNFDVEADIDGDGGIDSEECLDCSDFDIEDL